MREDSTNNGNLTLGVNGFGRIGKLTVWHHIGRKYFKNIIVNIGRESGTSMKDIAHYAERDSSYGMLHSFLYGQNAAPLITEIDEGNGSLMIDGTRVKFLRSERNPEKIIQVLLKPFPLQLRKWACMLTPGAVLRTLIPYKSVIYGKYRRHKGLATTDHLFS